MIDVCKERYVEDVDINDELDLDGDEYGDNDRAIFGYALVLQRNDIYEDGEPWVTLITSQGMFRMPAGHQVKVKIEE
jgi:hypothetical protein